MKVVPPGGLFQFAQKLPNNQFHFFYSSLEEDLIAQVRQYRLNNNIPLGDLSNEIAMFQKGRQPKIPGDVRTLRERVTNWKSNRMFNKIEFVSPEEAESRAEICVNCPFNQINYADDCIECHRSTARDLFAMREGKKTTNDQWLGACQITGQDNQTAVQLSPENLNHRVNFLEDLKKLYPKCWLLHLNEKQEA